MKNSAQQIVEYIGGMENVVSYTHCATRLRFQLKDRSLVDESGLKELDEVLGVVDQAGIFQVVIGPKVDQMYRLIQELEQGTNGKEASNTVVESNESLLNRVLGFISGSITPNMGVMVASGLISAVLSVLALTGVLSREGGTYTLWTSLAEVVFYFLPVLVAVSAAKRLNASPAMAAFISLATIHVANNAEKLSMFGVAVPRAMYSGNIIPVLLMVPLLALLEKILDKYIPQQVIFILKPFVCAIVLLPLTLFVLGPIGAVVGALLANFCVWLSSIGGVAYGVIALFAPLLILTGMHTMLIPVIINEITTLGYSYTFSFNIAVNFAIAGTVLAVGLKSKQLKTKSMGLSTGVTALLSVTEPALYGVVVPFRKTLITACIASGLSGVLVGLLQIKGFAPASVSLLTLPTFIGDDMSNFVKACSVALVALVLGFVLTFFTFKEEHVSE